MQYTTSINWKCHTPSFNPKSYDRTHTIQFKGGSVIQTSSAPEFLGKAELPNPEELFIASISSCFMLTFLYWAAMKGLPLVEYSAQAVGTLTKNSEGKMSMTEITLKPKLTFKDNAIPDEAIINELFKKAHEHCFISCSVKTNIIIQPENLTLSNVVL